VGYVRSLKRTPFKRWLMIGLMIFSDLGASVIVIKNWDAPYFHIFIKNKFHDFCRDKINDKDLFICLKEDYSTGDGAYYIIYDKYNQIGLPKDRQNPEWKNRAKPMVDSFYCYYQTVQPLGNNEYLVWSTCS
jgi:hypothetical protein